MVPLISFVMIISTKRNVIHSRTNHYISSLSDDFHRYVTGILTHIYCNRHFRQWRLEGGIRLGIPHCIIIIFVSILNKMNNNTSALLLVVYR